MVDGTFIVDPNNCNIYYKCNNGIATTFTCPQGQIFNKDTGMCITSSSGCNNVNSMCVGQSKGTFLGDDSTCSGYYFCNGVDAAGQHGNCPNGLNFNPKSQSCDYASNYPCSLSPQGNSMQAICSYVPNGKYFGVATNCANWGICDNGQYKTGVCGAGLFNTKLGVCDEDVSEVSCIQTKFEVGPKGDHILQGSDCSSWTSQFQADPQSCSGYYYCNAQKQAQWGQCKNNDFFSNGNCVDRTTVICNKGNNPCENTENSNFKWVNDPTNCKKYYYCSENSNSLSSSACPNDLWFNEIIQQCTVAKPTYAACVVQGGPPAPPSN